MSIALKTPRDVQRELASRFKARRLALNLTQEGLAARAGVSWSSLKRFEYTGLISLDALLKLSLVLECLGDFDGVCVDDGQSLAFEVSRRDSVGTETAPEGTDQVTYAPTELLTVYPGGWERRKVGRLALRQRQILFEYDPIFLASGIEISPLKLPLRRASSHLRTRSSTAFTGSSTTACRTAGDGCAGPYGREAWRPPRTN